MSVSTPASHDEGVGFGDEGRRGSVDRTGVPVAGLVPARGQLADAAEVVARGSWQCQMLALNLARYGTNLARRPSYRVPLAVRTPIDQRLYWSGRGDLNPRPQRPERCALTKLRYFPVTANRTALGDGRERPVVVPLPRQHGLDGVAGAQGVERLEDPALHSGTAGQEHVGTTVEQHKHRCGF